MTTIQDSIKERLNERLDFLVNCNPANEDLKPEIVNDIKNLFNIAIKEVQEETRKEITDDLGKLMDIDRARKLGDNLEIYQGKRECPICGANPEKQREMILSITNKEK